MGEFGLTCLRIHGQSGLEKENDLGSKTAWKTRLLERFESIRRCRFSFSFVLPNAP